MKYRDGRTELWAVNRGALALVAFVLVLIGSPGFSSDSESPAAAPITLGSRYSIDSKILNQTRHLNVYVPPSYAEGEERYPVLYLLDGGVHEDFVHMMGLAALAAPYRNIREFILVGIEGVDRYHDFTSPTTKDRDKGRLPTQGGSGKFREFVRKEVKPWVEKKLRVTDESAIIGESLAGLFVVELLLKEPDLFESYIAVSPSLQWDGQSLAKSADELLSAESYPAARYLFLTIADEGGGMQEGVDRLVAAINQHETAVKSDYLPMSNESHGTIFHPAALEAIRRVFATAEKFEP